MKRCLSLLAVMVTAISWGQSGWSRYQVTTRNPDEVQRLSDCGLQMFSDNLVIGRNDMIVGPGQLPQLGALRLPIQYVSDLPNPTHWDETHPQPMVDNYQLHYLRYDAIIAQYETWRAQFPKFVSRTQIGTTYGNRPIWAYRIKMRDTLRGRQPIRSVVINCGIHAREWISPSVGMYLFNMILNSIEARPSFYDHVADLTAFYFIPVINPDGYEYCWTNDRFWRKNRRNNGNGTFGVDLNRNFAKAWGGAGSSSNTNSETYRGPSAFSEPETNTFQAWLGTIPPVTGFIDFHSYGQYVLYAWGYTTALAPGDAWLRATGNAMKTALFDNGGTTYTAGPTGSTLYLAAGNSPDYVYDRFDAAAYTIELRDTGAFGFALPEDQILPTQVEAWGAFVQLAQRMLQR